jgi:FlaA1/EpsC-like NDP-sugar epimerase
MLELIEVNAVLEAMFNEMREAARDWMAAIPFVKCQQEIDCDRNAEGKVVVVTGGASGIGRGIALSALRHGARAIVIGDLGEAP